MYSVKNEFGLYYFKDPQLQILHREDGPALIETASTEWYYDGKHHREDGPAIISEEREIWFCHGKIHRDDGPAIICSNGTKKWLINAEFHRLDGPAVEWTNGSKEWWISGERIACSTQEEFDKLIRLKEFW